jgi:inosose dehydratase
MSNRKLLKSSKIGLVPLNWRFTDERRTEVVSKFQEYGFKGIQISETHARSAEYRKLFADHEIEAAELYIAIKCEIDSIAQNSDEETKRQIDAAKFGGVEMVVFAVDGTHDRDIVTSNAQNGPHLSTLGYKALAEHLNKWGRYCDELGMRFSFHPHSATYIETPEETRELFALLDPKMGLCLDVGHWIVGGGDPIGAINEYGSRITHIHVKDVDGDVLRRLKSREIESMEFAVVEHKIFAPAGTGLLDLPVLFAALDQIGFQGWLMSEQDSAWEPSEEKSEVSMANISAALK